ncbi:MAK10-like protein [Tanacetum coccineum]
MGDANPIRTLGDYSKPSHEGYRNTIELPVGKNMVPLRSDTIRERTRLHLFQFSLLDQARNSLECLPAGSITTWEDLTTHFLDQFFQPGRIAKLRNDILIRTIDQSAGGKLRDQNAKEAWALLEDLAFYDNESWNDPRDFAKPVKAIALPQDVPMNKVTTLCEICSGPHDTQYCIKNPEQAFIEYASSLTDKARVRKDDDPHDEGHEDEGSTTIKGLGVEYFDTFLTRSELAYHKYLMRGPIPSIFLRNPIITEGCPSNLKIPCNIRHVHVEKAYIDLNSPLNIMT